MSAQVDPSLQIKDLDTGEVVSLQQWDQMYPEKQQEDTPAVARSSSRIKVKPTIPKDVDFDTFMKNKSHPFFTGVAIAQVIQAHKGAIRCIAGSKDGLYIATGGEGGDITLFEYKGYLTTVRKYEGHKSDVSCIAFSSENLILSSSLDSTVKLWHPSQPKDLATFQHENAVIAVACHPTDPSIFISCTFGNNVLIWSIRENEVIKTLDFVSPPTAATFSPDGQRIAIGCYNGYCFFYAMPDFRYVTQFIAGPRKKKKTANKKVTSIQFQSPTHFFVSTNDSRVRLYSLENFSVIRKYLGHESKNGLLKTAISADKKLVMIGSEDKGAVVIWPIDHEPYFKAKMGGFTRDRNLTCEGFKLGKKVEITGSLFNRDTTTSHLSVVVSDGVGNVYLVLSD